MPKFLKCTRLLCLVTAPLMETLINLRHTPKPIMTQITNNFEPGSCTFQAGSSMNGDVTINAPICQGWPKQKDVLPDDIGSPLYLAPIRGVKIDFIRMMNSWYECGKVVDANGAKPTKKVYFAWIGKMFNMDLTDYEKDLSTSMSSGTAFQKQVRIFNELKAKHEDIYNSK